MDRVSRKDVIINLLAFPAVAASIAATAESASAAATMDPKSVNYQSKPKGNQKCSGCVFYIAAKTNPSKNNGACKQVKGAISPNGWCSIYSPKSH